MDEFAALRRWLTKCMFAAAVAFTTLDAIDDMLFENRWPGCPREILMGLGVALAGLYAPEAIRRLKPGNGNGKPKAGEPS